MRAFRIIVSVDNATICVCHSLLSGRGVIESVAADNAKSLFFFIRSTLYRSQVPNRKPFDNVIPGESRHKRLETPTVVGGGEGERQNGVDGKNRWTGGPVDI